MRHTISYLRRSILTAIILGFSIPILGIASARVIQAPKTVTLDAPGWSLKRICASISQQIGQDVEPHGDIVNDYLIVHVKNVPWPELQKKLAWVEYGKWYLSGKTLTIERDKTQVQARIQQNLDAIAKDVETKFKQLPSSDLSTFDVNQFIRRFKTKAQADAQKQNPASPNLTIGYELAERDMQNDFPFTLAIINMVKAFPPASFAAIRPGQRFVFSNHANSLQQPLPDAVESAISGVINVQAKLNQAASASGVDFSAFADKGSFTLLSNQDTFLFALRVDADGMYHASFRAFDPEGKLLIQFASPLPFIGKQTAGFAEPAQQTFIKLDPAYVANCLVLGKSFDPSVTAMPASLPHALRNPAQQDPTQIAVDPILTALYPNSNVVERNDYLVYASPSAVAWRKGNLIPADMFESAEGLADTDFQAGPGWVTLRPNFSAMSGIQNLPRSAYDDLIAGISSDGKMDFNPAMRFAGELGADGFDVGQSVSGILGALTFGKNPLAVSILDWKIFALAGTLESGDLAQAESPHGLDLTELNSSQKSALLSILGGQFLGKSSDRPGGFKPTIPQLQERIFGAITINQEPTVAFANSIPRGFLTISSKSDAVVEFSTQEKNPSGVVSNYSQTLSPEDFALQISRGQIQADQSPQLHAFDQQTVTLTLSFPGSGLAPITARFVTRAYSPTVYARWKDLPSAIKSRIETTLAHHN